MRLIDDEYGRFVLMLIQIQHEGDKLAAGLRPMKRRVTPQASNAV